jgi:hypothetical protein
MVTDDFDVSDSCFSIVTDDYDASDDLHCDR